MELYYINHEKQKLDFTKFPYLIKNIDSLLDFNNDYDIENGEIVFVEEPAKIQLVLNISADIPEEYSRAVDAFYDVMEADVKKNKCGRLYYGSQYILCQLVESKKSDWNMGVCFMLNDITLLTLFPAWIEEKQFQFKRWMSDEKETEFLEFPFDYPFDFMGETKGIGYLNNPYNQSCHFEMIIYGPCINPRIVVSGHPYEVTTQLECGEYMVIDSRNRTLKRFRIDGEVIDEFHNRNTQFSIFDKLQDGNNLVSWDGGYGFDITIYSERREPRGLNYCR